MPDRPEHSGSERRHHRAVSPHGSYLSGGPLTAAGQGWFPGGSRPCPGWQSGAPLAATAGKPQ